MQWGAVITVVLYIKEIDVFFVNKTDTFVLLNILIFKEFIVISKKKYLVSL